MCKGEGRKVGRGRGGNARGIEIDKCADDFCAVQSAGNWMVASISATKLRSDAASLHCQYIVEQRLKCLT